MPWLTGDIHHHFVTWVTGCPHWRTVRTALNSLLADARGREAGDGRTLQKEQEKEMQKLIREKLPDQLKRPLALRTRKAVAQLIEARDALRLPVRIV